MAKLYYSIFLFLFFLNSQGSDSVAKRYKLGIDVAFQHVINWNSSSRFFDLNYHKISFFTIGLIGTKRIRNIDFNIGVKLHEEYLDNYYDKYGNGFNRFTLRTDHFSIPFGADFKLTRNIDRYLFARVNYILDYIFNAQKLFGINKSVNRKFMFYRDYIEIGLGYNTLIKDNYGFHTIISLYPLPFTQKDIFNENVAFSQYGIVIGAYKIF